MPNVPQPAVIASASQPGCSPQIRTQIRTQPEPQTSMQIRIQTDLHSTVEIVLHPHPAAPFAVACTDGHQIYLNPHRHHLTSLQWVHAIAHELVHIVQQRQGRVRASGTRHGFLFNDDPCLEREADRLAPRIATRLLNGLFPPLPQAHATPILQCLISIKGHPVRSQTDLTPQAQSLLPLVPGATDWLASIASTPIQYQFTSDLELVAGLNAGVHGDPMMLLRKLQVSAHPEALSGFAKDDIDSIVQVELGTGDNSVARMRVRRLLAAQQLLTESELQVGDEFPTQIGLATEPLFRSSSLAARIALFNLVNEGVTEHALDTQLQTEAAAFAIQRSLNVFEFIDYYRFFMALLTEPSPDPTQAAKRARFAESTADSLADVSFDLLWAPTLESIPTTSAMPGVIAQWSERGFRLGFPRLSAALAHLAQNVKTDGATGTAARQIIQTAMAQLQSLWVSTVPRSARVAQTGIERLYAYDLPAATAHLSLAADGTLTIADYQPTPPGMP